MTERHEERREEFLDSFVNCWQQLDFFFLRREPGSEIVVLRKQWSCDDERLLKTKKEYK